MGGVPRDIHLVSRDRTRFDLHLVLSQVETNGVLDAQAFQVRVPPSADPITLEELKRGGPLGIGPGNGADGR